MLRISTVCHRLNSVLNDAAECCAEMKAFVKWWKRSTFFGFSAPNWTLPKAFGTYAKSFTLKRLISTRWECRHKSVIALINQYLLKTLHHLNVTSNYGKFRHKSGQNADKCHKSSFGAVSKQLSPNNCLQTTPVNVRKPVRIIRTSWWNCCICTCPHHSHFLVELLHLYLSASFALLGGTVAYLPVRIIRTSWWNCCICTCPHHSHFLVELLHLYLSASFWVFK